MEWPIPCQGSVWPWRNCDSEYRHRPHLQSTKPQIGAIPWRFLFPHARPTRLGLISLAKFEASTIIKAKCGEIPLCSTFSLILLYFLILFPFELLFISCPSHIEDNAKPKCGEGFIGFICFICLLCLTACLFFSLLHACVFLKFLFLHAYHFWKIALEWTHTWPVHRMIMLSAFEVSNISPAAC